MGGQERKIREGEEGKGKEGRGEGRTRAVSGKSCMIQKEASPARTVTRPSNVVSISSRSYKQFCVLGRNVLVSREGRLTEDEDPYA